MSPSPARILAHSSSSQRVDGHGVEHLLLLGDHVVDHLGQREAGAHGQGGVVLGDGLPRLLDEVADVVVDGPHDLARTLHAVVLEEGEELVLLAEVVLVDLGEPLHGVGQRALEARPGGAVRRLADRLRHLAEGGGHLQQRLVLALERVQRVAGRHADRLVAGQRVGEHLHVHVAEPLDLGVGHAALDELLLHGGDLGGLHVLDEFLEPRLDLFHRLAGVQVLDDRVQLLEARGVDGLGVGHVGDGRPRAGLALDLVGDVGREDVERDVALLRHRVQGRHPPDGPAEDRIGQLLELGVVLSEELQQERILLEQRVDGGLGGDGERRGGHTRLQRLGLSLGRMYHYPFAASLDVAQAVARAAGLSARERRPAPREGRPAAALVATSRRGAPGGACAAAT